MELREHIAAKAQQGVEALIDSRRTDELDSGDKLGISGEQPTLIDAVAAQVHERPAVELEGRSLSYQELFSGAASLAATLQHRAASGGPALTGVFAHRSATAFAGILAALFRGHGYVPLNRTFPPARTAAMLARAECRAVIVDRTSAEQLDQVLEGLEESVVILLPEGGDLHTLAARWPKHTFLGPQDLEPAEAWQPEEAAPDSIAYLLFTSGSTGLTAWAWNTSAQFPNAEVSAGAFLTYAVPLEVMARGTNLGAASPSYVPNLAR